MTTRKLQGPLGGDYQTDGSGNAVPINTYPLTGADDVPLRLADHEARVTATEDTVALMSDMVTPPPTLFLAPAGSRDAGGTVTPTVSGTVSTTPASYGDGWALVAATRNLHINNSAETDLTGYQATSGITMTRDTSASSVGSASVKAEAASGAEGKRLLLYESISPTLTGASAIISSVDVWGAGSIQVETTGDYSDGTTWAGSRGSIYTLTDSPVRAGSLPATIDPAKTVTKVRTSIWFTSAAITLYTDAWQAEAGAVATPFAATTRVAGTVTLASVTANLQSSGQDQPGPSYAVDRTIHAPSDIHVGKTGSLDRRNAATADMQALNAQIVHRIWPGDMTDAPGDLTQRAEAEAWLRTIDPDRTRWDVIAGNHDFAGAYDGADFAADWGYADRYWIKDFSAYRLLGIIPENHGPGNAYLTMYASDLAWLDAQLAATDRKCIIVFHAPLKDTVMGVYPTNDTRYYANPDASIRAILDAHSNAYMWIAGHTHNNATEANVFMQVSVGSRTILHLNCSAIAYVAGATGGVGGYGPLQSPVVTFDPGHVTVRWRDHQAQSWQTINGKTALSLPAFETRGNILVRYVEDGVAGVAVLDGPGQFGKYGEVALENGDLILRSTSRTIVETLVGYNRLAAPDRVARMTAYREPWTYANAQGVNDWVTP